MKKKKNFPLGLRTWGDISIHTYIHICIHTHTCEMKVLVTQSCLTLCDPMDCNPQGSSAHRTLQARILERVAICSPRGSFQPRDWTQVSRIAGGFFTIRATREAIYIRVCVCTGLAKKFLWVSIRSYKKTQTNFLFSPIHKTGYISILGANLKNFWE